MQDAPSAVNEDDSAKAQPVAVDSPAAQPAEEQDAEHEQPPTS